MPLAHVALAGATSKFGEAEKNDEDGPRNTVGQLINHTEVSEQERKTNEDNKNRSYYVMLATAVGILVDVVHIDVEITLG